MAGQLQLVFGFFLSIVIIGVHGVVEIHRPTTSGCNKLNTHFHTKHIYTYFYTVTTSNGFIGTSPMSSSSRLTCTVILEVPRKCEVIMKLSNCALQGITGTSYDEYFDIPDSNNFLQQLESYPVYFQINEGMIVKDTIVADLRETVTALNIKRGIMSAVQFDIHIPEQIEESSHEVKKDITDLFGTCPTLYIYDQDNGNDITTLRKLPECHLHQIYIKQYAAFSSTIRSVSGGVKQDITDESIYPFDTRVYCTHSLGENKLLKTSTCTQQHYFKPAAFVNEQQTIHSAMTKVIQKLELLEAIHKSQPLPDRSLTGRKIIDIGFEYGDQSYSVTLDDLENAMELLKSEYQDTNTEELPASFENLVLLMRKSEVSVLKDYMEIVFACGKECTKLDIAVQTFYLDGLSSCGTANCHLQHFNCIEHGHLDRISVSEFLHGLAAVENVAEVVQLKMLDYCKTSGLLKCWLPLGTILSKTQVTDKKLSVDSVLGKTVTYLRDELDNHCSADKLEVPPRNLIIWIKVIGNIGIKNMVTKLEEGVDLQTIYFNCLGNKAIPDSVDYVILQEILETYRTFGYQDLQSDTTDKLFELLNDGSRHNNLRTLAFSILSKTSDEVLIKKLLQKIDEEDNKQLIYYMVNSLYLLRQNDQPDLQHVREAWKKEKLPVMSERTKPFRSKPLYLGQFFKIPITELFGGVLTGDLIYDPTNSHFTSVSAQLNYFFENVKYNVFELTLNIHGIDQLLAILDVKPEELSQQIMKLMSGGISMDKMEEFPKFQQFIAKKVKKLLDEVNFPSVPDFDIYFDVKKQGKSFVFTSLQELLEMMRGMATHNPRYQQEFLQRLLQSIDKDIFKATEFVYIKKIIPSCAGIPLNMTAKLSGWNRIKSNIKSNLLMVLGGKATDMTFGLNQLILFNNELSGEVVIPIGNAHISGLRAVMRLGSERDYQMDATLAKDNAETRIFKLEFSPISEGKTSETLLSARGRLFIKENEAWAEVKEDIQVQSTYQRCLSNDFQMAVGRSLCATFTYPNVGTSDQHPYFPLSGPFDMEVEMEKVDGVEKYEASLEFTNTEEYVHVYFKNWGPGIELNRRSVLDVTFDKTTKRIEGHLESAEFELEYKTVYDISQRDSGEVSEYLWMNGEPMLGYRLKGNTDGKYINVNLNLALPYVSWDIDYTRLRTYGSTEKHHKMTFSYYCSKLRPLLYLLHLSPTHAMANADTTVVTLEVKTESIGDQKQSSVSLGFHDDTVEISMIREMDNIKFIPTYTTMADGIKKTISGVVTLVYSNNVLGAPEMHVTIEMDGQDFGLDMTGSVDGTMQDFVVLSEVTYDKEKANSAVARKRRSGRSWYESIIALEKAVASKFYQVERAVLGKRSVDQQQKPTSTEQYLSSVVPSFPSIWDLSKWSINLEMKGKLQQIQGPKDAYPSLELILDSSIDHPWNGGYRTILSELRFGKSLQTSYRNFRYWTSGQLNTSYSNLDRTPTLDENGEAMKVYRDGEIRVNRQVGRLFDFGIEHNGPHIQVEYNILFDWAAVTHHEPLIFVSSKHENDFFPFFDHTYEEKLSLEDGHWIHIQKFSHKLISYDVTTDVQFNGPGSEQRFLVTESGSLQSALLYPGKTYTLTGKLQAPSNNLEHLEYILDLQDSTVPDKLFVYTYFLKKREFGVRIGEKAPSDIEVTNLWTYTFELDETVVRLTLTWDPKVDEEAKKYLPARVMYPGITLKTYAVKLRNDISLPYLKQPIFFTSVSVDDLLSKHIKPQLMKGLVLYNNIMTNFVPQEQRKGAQGNLHPRIYRLVEILKNVKETGPSRMTVMLKKIQFLAATGLGNAYLFVGAKVVNNPKFQTVLENRKGVYAFTVPFVFKEKKILLFLDFFEFRELTKHIAGAISYYQRMEPQKVEFNYGMIFKHSSSTPHLTIKTFAGYIREIPGSITEIGTYLLATDILKRQYYLTVSPSGMTLGSNKGTITITFDNEIYIDDCLDPSSDIEGEIGDKTISWERVGDDVSVKTNFGVTISCSLGSVKVCLVGLKKMYRNATVGLLGTNNYDAFTDKRGLHGNIVTDNALFLSEYCLTGCQNIPDAPEIAKDCGREQSSECGISYSNYNVLSASCKSAVGLSYKFFEELCTKNTGCDEDPGTPCVLMEKMVKFCEREGLQGKQDKQVTCNIATPHIPSLLSLGSKGTLDVVFVISLHQDMISHGLQPLEYMLEIVDPSIGEWSHFHETRISVIGFGGDGNQKDPFILKQSYNGGERYFSMIGKFDWSVFMQEMGATGQIDTGMDSFKALEMAIGLPFKVGAHKVIVLLTSHQQNAESYSELETLKADLTDQGITLHVIQPYLELQEQPGAIGVGHSGKLITASGDDQGYIDIKNDYKDLVQATRGALWSIDDISLYKSSLVKHLVELEILKTKETCPAA